MGQSHEWKIRMDQSYDWTIRMNGPVVRRPIRTNGPSGWIGPIYRSFMCREFKVLRVPGAKCCPDEGEIMLDLPQPLIVIPLFNNHVIIRFIQ